MIGFYNPGHRSKKWRKSSFTCWNAAYTYLTVMSGPWSMHSVAERNKKIIHRSELTLQKCLLEHLDFDSVVDEEKQLPAFSLSSFY